MAQIVDELGWPTRTMVGDNGAQAAWLLVQHADHDVAFQRKCLGMMKPLVGQAQVFRGTVAYLTDRVLVNEGKRQVYATQFHTVGGLHQPRPMIDPVNVDKRRLAMGLTTLKEYTELMRT